MRLVRSTAPRCGVRMDPTSEASMNQKNLVLQWIRQCTPAQCRCIGERIRKQIETARETSCREDGPGLARLMATVLFVECAEDLELTPLELHGLLDDPRQQCMDALALIALDWIGGATDRPRHDSVRSRRMQCPPVES